MTALGWVVFPFAPRESFRMMQVIARGEFCLGVNYYLSASGSRDHSAHICWVSWANLHQG